MGRTKRSATDNGPPRPDRSGRGGPLSVADRFVRPILGHYGGADEGIPLDQVEQLDRALEAGGVSHEIYVYPNATHSFFDRGHEAFAAEADQAWRRTIAFLGRTLAASPAD